MASIERTAYPRFKRYYTLAQLQKTYTPTSTEIAFGRSNTQGDKNFFNLMVLLKSFQRLGYFPSLEQIPQDLINYLRDYLKLSENIDVGYDQSRTLYRHKKEIRAYFQVTSFDKQARHLISETVSRYAQVMDNPADLINVAIEMMIKDCYELPGFNSLNRLVCRLRTRVNHQLFSQVTQQLTPQYLSYLDSLLKNHPVHQRSPYNDLKKLPKKSSRNHLNDLLVHLTWLESLGDISPYLEKINPSKIQYWAAEAKSLDSSEIKKITQPKRATLLLCLIYTNGVKTRDYLVTMFLKQMQRIHHKAQEKLELIRQQLQEKVETVVSVFANVLPFFADESPKAQWSQVKQILQANGGVEHLLSECDAINAYQGNNHSPLLWQFYKGHRSSFFRLINALKLESTSTDLTLIKAIQFLKDNSHRRGEWLSGEVDLSFASLEWQKFVLGPQKNKISRRHFEVCVFSYLASELKSGDICVVGTQDYADTSKICSSLYHIRYGGYGGIAYHHVADSYVALFSHFIPCGTWEAVYIIDGLLKNSSLIQPHTLHADTQGQSTPVFALSHLLGIKLMPRIRNWKDLTFYRPDKNTTYQHIDSLFSDSINWELIKTHWQDLFRVVLSISTGKISSAILLRKLGNYSRKNRLYKAFRELGRVVRTVFLLEYISDAQLRQQIQAATNKVESYNGFSKWFCFGGNGIIANNDPEEQEKIIKYNTLVANAVIFQNAVDLTEILQQLKREGYLVTSEDIKALSPYLTEHIKRFGDYWLDMNIWPKALEEMMALGV